MHAFVRSLTVALAAVSAILLAGSPAVAAAPGSAADQSFQEWLGDDALTIDQVLAQEPAGEAGTTAVSSKYYCAVVDGTTGCKDYAYGQGLVVARLYETTRFRNSVIVVFNPHYSVGCTSGTGDNEGRFNINTALRNKINSVKTYNRCDVKLYNGLNGTGSSTPFIDEAANLNVYGFNQSAESVQIS